MDSYAKEWEKEKKDRISYDFEEETFGRCYYCEDYNDHECCIGLPCECSCPLPDQREREQKRQKILNTLSAEDRKILGI